MRAALAIFCLLASNGFARAEPPNVDFGGERYRLAYEKQVKLASGQPGDGIAEFTLKGETVEDWTKLFAFHAYPQSGDDPVLAAATLGRLVQEANKDARYALIEDRQTGDAIVDFLIWTPGSDIMEFNVFKYARADYGPGLVALQFAQRIRADDGVAAFQALRERAVKQMAETDIAQARDFFAARIRRQSWHEPSSGSAAGGSTGGRP
jgi:hypothetical protein